MLNKFATGIVIAAISITAVSAPAKADKEFNRLVAIIAGGLIINEIIKDKRDDRYESKEVRHRHGDGRWHTHASREEADRHYKKKKHSLHLPEKCKRIIKFKNGKTKPAFSQRCLQKRGYRVTQNGTVRHHKWPGRTRRPNLI